MPALHVCVFLCLCFCVCVCPGNLPALCRRVPSVKKGWQCSTPRGFLRTEEGAHMERLHQGLTGSSVVNDPLLLAGGRERGGPSRLGLPGNERLQFSQACDIQGLHHSLTGSYDSRSPRRCNRRIPRKRLQPFASVNWLLIKRCSLLTHISSTLAFRYRVGN